MKKIIFLIVCFCGFSQCFAQVSLNSIHTDFVLYQHRVDFDKYMREETIHSTFALPLDSNSAYDYESACLAASQFMIKNDDVQNGFKKIYAAYSTLPYSLKRSWLEAVYGLYPNEYLPPFKKLITKESQPKLFAMLALYIKRADNSTATLQLLQKQLQQTFPAYSTSPLLREVKKYLDGYGGIKKQAMPPVTDLFFYQAQLQQKIIYSFQRWNRDYPGLAIIQNADGSFVKDSTGKLLVMEQLARSASGLPYFITDGNTPQGIYSIQGTAVTHNNFIGPTPTIQMLMPFENDYLYWSDIYDSSKNELANYLDLLPVSWRNYAPLTEAFYAGKIGRTEIIAHGTTLDPEYFKGKPYYPFSPTLGCLCAKEIWDMATGKPVTSEQLNLVNGFLSTEWDTGFLMVINLDDQQRPVQREEVERLVEGSENN